MYVKMESNIILRKAIYLNQFKLPYLMLDLILRSWEIDYLKSDLDTATKPDEGSQQWKDFEAEHNGWLRQYD